MLLHCSHKLWPTLDLSFPKTFLLRDSNEESPWQTTIHYCLSPLTNLKLTSSSKNVSSCHRCEARRRTGYEDDEDEEFGYNEELDILEMYSQSARGEALLVNAMIDDQQVEVLIFKGFSSCLSYKTSADPSKSVLPQRAVIKSIDRIKGPFNPANIEYIEQGLTWDTFRSRLSSD